MNQYFTKREMTRPLTAGKSMFDFTFDEIRNFPVDLTEAEKTSDFAKYFYEPMAELQPQMKAAVQADPLQMDQMYMPQEAGPILLNGSKAYPLNGYGVLENGVGYSSMLVHQDGITDAMIAHYREHFAATDDPEVRTLFYKTWFPWKHLIHFDDGIVEDFGWGFCCQVMDWDIFNIEKHFGIRMEDIPRIDSSCIAVVGLAGECINVDDPEDRSFTCMIQYTRDTENGRDLCIHYWNGIQLNKDGNMDIHPNVGRAEMTKRMKGMMEHAMYECCNECKHIKEFWDETQG